MSKREGFWRGSDRNPEAIAHAVPEPGIEGFAQHTFESAGDVLEGHDPEVLPLPTERHPVTGEPRTLLRKRQVKQLLSMTERILEVRATTSGSDIIVASFTDSSFDLTEVAGRHGIEIADQASCAAGWDPLSSSGRQRFWHVHCTLAPKVDHLQFPVAVQQWLSVSNPKNCLCNHVSGRLADQLRLYVKKRYFPLDTSRLRGSWTLVTLKALLGGSEALLKHVTHHGE